MEKPKILYICTAPPYGEVYGMGLRTRNIGKLLQTMGEVSVLAIGQNRWSERDISETSKHFKFLGFLEAKATSKKILNRIQRELDPRYLDTHSLKLSEKDQQFLHAQLSSHDLAWVHTIKIANITRIEKWSRAVIDVDDYPSQFHLTVVRNSKSIREKFHRTRRAMVWKRREALLSSRFSSIVVCKEADKEAFGTPDTTFVVGNGFEAFPKQRDSFESLQAQPRLGLIGNYNYRLNSDAIEWFLSDAWPQVRAAIPDVRLRLVGRGGERFANPEQNIDGLGFVDDPAAELASWSALIAPTRMGGGTSVKIAEAFSRRLPVVASPHGARGYSVKHADGILIADEGPDFAAHCISVLQDPAYGERLAENAHAFFDKHLAWNTMLPKVKEAAENALGSDKL